MTPLLAAAVWWLVPHIRDETPARMDYPGAIGLALGMTIFLIGVSKASTWGWLNLRTLGALGLGLVILAAWTRLERRRPEPLVQIRTMLRPTLLLTNIAAIGLGCSMVAQIVVLPQLLQAPLETGYGLGQSLMQVALWLLPVGVMSLVFAPLSALLLRRVGAKNTLIVGACVIALGYLTGPMMLHSPWQLLLMSCIVSAGIGIGFGALRTMVLDSVPASEAGASIGLNSQMRSVGTSLGAALMTTVLVSATVRVAGRTVPAEHAFLVCFLIAAAVAVATVVVLGLIPGTRPVEGSLRRLPQAREGARGATKDSSAPVSSRRASSW